MHMTNAYFLAHLLFKSLTLGLVNDCECLMGGFESDGVAGPVFQGLAGRLCMNASV